MIQEKKPPLDMPITWKQVVGFFISGVGSFFAGSSDEPEEILPIFGSKIRVFSPEFGL